MATNIRNIPVFDQDRVSIVFSHILAKWITNRIQDGSRDRPIWTPKGSKTGPGNPGTATIQEGKTPFYGNSTLQMVSARGPRPHPKMTKMGSQMDTPKMVIFGPPFGQVRNRTWPCFDTLDVTFEHRGVKSRAPALKPHDAHMCTLGFKLGIREGSRTMDPILGVQMGPRTSRETPNPDMDLI